MEKNRYCMRAGAGLALTRDQIKLLALLFMTINHIGWIFMTEGTAAAELCKGIGYFTAPVMCYFLTEGFYGTRSVRLYARRLLIFTLISQIPFDLAFAKGTTWKFEKLSMMFTLLVCLLMLQIRHNLPPGNRQMMAVLACVLVTCLADWGGMAPAMVLFFDLQKEGRITEKMVWMATLAMIGVNNILEAVKTGGSAAVICRNGLFSMTGPVLACLVLVLAYADPGPLQRRPGKAGRAVKKWFFYGYYPAHLALMAILRLTLLK